MSTKCVLGCGNALLPHSRLKTCGMCRATMRRWLAEPAVRFKKYITHLALRQRRAENIGGQKKRTW